MPDTWTPPASDRVQTGWTPPASDRVSGGDWEGSAGVFDDRSLPRKIYDTVKAKINDVHAHPWRTLATLPTSPILALTDAITPSSLSAYSPNPTVQGVVHGLSSAPVAVGQMVANAVNGGNDPVMNARVKSYNDFFNQFPQDRTGEMVGQALPFLFSGGSSAAAQAPTAASRALAIAKAAGIGATALPAFTPESDFSWQKKGQEALLGGAGGLGLGVAAEVAKPVIGALAPRVKALFGGDPQLEAKAAQVMKETEALGVNLKPSQIRDLVKKGTIPEELVQARAAADSFGADLRQRVTDTPFAGLDEVKAAAEGSGKRADAAKALLDQIDNAGTEAQDLVKTSAGLQAFRAKLKADSLYAYRDKLGAALTDINTPQTVQAIDDAIGKLKLDQSGDNSAQIKALEAFKQNLSGPNGAQDHLGTVGSGGSPVVIRNGEPSTGPVGATDHLGLPSGRPVVIRNGVPTPPTQDVYGTVVDPGSNAAPVFERGPAAPQVPGQPSPTFERGPADVAPPSGNRSFQALSATRANLGDRISAAYKGSNAVTGSLDASTLQPIKNALEADLQAAAEQSGNPDLIQADRAARKFYSEYSGTFKDPTVVKAVTSADPDQVFNAIAKAGAYKGQRVYNALDPKGQAAFASGLFDKALDAAFNKRTGTWIPGNVSGALFDMQKSLGIAFTGQDKLKLDGIQNLMQSLAKLEPENASALGERFSGIAEKAGGKTGVVKTVYDFLKNGGTDALFNSPRGKRILFAASEAKPGSPAMERIMTVELPKLMTGSSSTTTALPLAADNPNPQQDAMK